MRSGLVKLLTVALVLAGTAVPGTASAAGRVVSEPVYDFASAIRETVWVDTGRDGDADGRDDRVAADLVRPREAADRGIKVPVIMDASPYYSCCGRGGEKEVKTYDGAGRPVGFPLYYDNFFVPRGYAVVLVDLAGTNRSRGCVDVGGVSDVGSAKSVVDWLNGRATGYSSATGGTAVSAAWSTGNVGMIGKSYDGTIANGVAATGVAGLKTIVPIAAISSWYDYYRTDGAVGNSGSPAGLAQTVSARNQGQNCSAANQRLRQDFPANGDYSPAWLERDHVAAAKNVRASVFAVNGVNDLNVKTINFGQWWSALASTGVDRKLWLSQTGHVDPFDFRRAEWVAALHQWFDHYLLGLDNGVGNSPRVSVERQPDVWVDQTAWPAAGTRDVVLRPVAGPTAGVGTMTSGPAVTGSASITDTGRVGEATWAAQPTATSTSRVLYSTGVLAQDLHVSGTGTVTVTVTPSTPTARVSAVLVDYGRQTIRNYGGAGEGVKFGSAEDCWGASTTGDDACYRIAATDTANVGLHIFSRGWADLANHRSLSREEQLVPGRPYTMTFRLASTDKVVPKGHQLALIIGGTDAGFVSAPAQPPRLTVDLSKTFVTLPLDGTTPVAGVPGSLPAHPAQVVATEPARLDHG
ncbi:Xaa-Pro dipeptidyl-peptidase [Actinosynnema sp. NPDC047251]|uniref:Putative Xaa-Pro dipeptidyl-peptidase n=1 Tax=Saccharothrix espanaensis (strain ATCC 51144 / DSM 44229 / JCM 9112 / NBRC 15066 / NRRL 15764) TaxID=1179773 RepID=K0JTW7_SACES|nr:Xaa-Pro dipeptidyl-peptidase [Saccharothrix espanaensis]CCH31240.1 putative Xaa-Pro dipeptidyl-peptidase [Saccharothrix espanaensis DSM 44229]